MNAQHRIAEALRSLGYTCADVDMEEAAVGADVELREVTASPVPIELREASGGVVAPGRTAQPQRTTGQPLPSMAELEQRMTVALRDIHQSRTDGALTAVNRTQQAQKGGAALTEVSTPTPAQRIDAAMKAIREGR